VYISYGTGFLVIFVMFGSALSAFIVVCIIMVLTLGYEKLLTELWN
jgi:hypothetical protein